MGRCAVPRPGPRAAGRRLPRFEDRLLDRVAAQGLAQRRPAVRAVAVQLLGRSEEARFAGLLGARIRDEREDEMVRRTAVRALKDLPQEAALPARGQARDGAGAGRRGRAP